MSRNYNISQKGIDLIKKWEGVRTTAYYDVAGILTIGYGWTGLVDGKRITPNTRITLAKAEELLRSGVVSYVNAVNNVLTRDATQNQFDAMVSLCYNIGTGAFQNSTLIKRFNSGNIVEASNQFLVWNKATVNGKLVAIQGLTNRRKDEKTLFDTAGGVMTNEPYVSDTTLEGMATMVINNQYGEGEFRKTSLGGYFTGVMAIVNQRLNVWNASKTVSVLADETLKGKYGNGNTRKHFLGTYYEPVQKLINKRYK